MHSETLYASTPGGITHDEISALLHRLLDSLSLRRVLIIPPDITRLFSYGGEITCMLYNMLEERSVAVDILPALGSHLPMGPAQLDEMFPGIPHSRFFVHDWRTDTVEIGTVPAPFVGEVSEGRYTKAIPVEVNRMVLNPSYDLVLSVGQVVPHEVAGMSNYTKNIFVGCGGSAMINASHYVGALYGMERVMGRDGSPVHKIFDYAQHHFLSHIPLCFLLTVNTVQSGRVNVRCLSAGSKRDAFERAIAASQKCNIDFVDKPLQKVVVYLDPREFRRLWVGNKAVYRTRMAIADGGELVIIAPGVAGAGEDIAVDALIRRYGYCGRDKVCHLVNNSTPLAEDLSAAAHLIHASSDGRFSITYATGGMSQKEIENLHFGYMPVSEALRRYPVDSLKPGFNQLDGEEIFFIQNPAVGLWALKGRFKNPHGNTPSEQPSDCL